MIATLPAPASAACRATTDLSQAVFRHRRDHHCVTALPVRSCCSRPPANAKNCLVFCLGLTAPGAASTPPSGQGTRAIPRPTAPPTAATVVAVPRPPPPPLCQPLPQ